jgi:hypothetical protein
MAKKKRRESVFVIFARLAHELAKKEFTPYSHPKSPKKFTQPQLVACILLMHRMRLSYRDMEEWLLASDAVVNELGLKEVPTYSTLARATARLLTLERIDRMNTQLLRDLEIEEEAVAIDATGFQMTQASGYYVNRLGWKVSLYWKGFYGVGLSSLFILGRSQSFGPGHDGSKLETMRRNVRPFMRRRRWVLLADGGFDVRTVRPDDLIPPRRTGRTHSITAPERRARADLVSAARLDGLFGQRWKVETVISVIKRKFGSAIRSRKYSLQRREPAIKMLVYNIHL